MIVPIGPPLSLKETLRLKMTGERQIAAAARPDAAIHAAAHFMTALAIKPGAKVALYHPIKDELDTKPLAEALLEQDAEIGLPVVVKKKAPLVFRRFERGDPLVEGAFGVMTPTDAAPVFEPQIVVVPLLGFDRRGGRLGYGGGFYDRTLRPLRAERPVTAVGYAFGAQEMDAVPMEDLDEPLDWIITERGAHRSA